MNNDESNTTYVMSEFKRQVESWRLLQIAWFLKIQANDFNRASSPNMRNIQPVDVDQLGEIFAIIGDRLENIWKEGAAQ